MNDLPEALQRVWDVADKLAARHLKDPRRVLDPCGLLLERPLRRWTYSCTPANALTFASTGGDGVHYGLLELIGAGAESWPVVMTVPMADTQNLVIAADLREFLGLGYHVGWFSLEGLVYGDPEGTVDYFSAPDTESSDRETMLATLRSEVPISYVRLSLVRIQALQLEFGQHIRPRVD